MVALLFGVVTDYGLFYMSRFRRRLRGGIEPARRARETAEELTPLILACGVAVAAGAAALVVAKLGFLRAFGPGMAVAVLVGLAGHGDLHAGDAGADRARAAVAAAPRARQRRERARDRLAGPADRDRRAGAAAHHARAACCCSRSWPAGWSG